MGILESGMHVWLLLLSRVLLVQVDVIAKAGRRKTRCRHGVGTGGRRQGARTALTACDGEERNTRARLATGRGGPPPRGAVALQAPSPSPARPQRASGEFL